MRFSTPAAASALCQARLRRAPSGVGAAPPSPGSAGMPNESATVWLGVSNPRMPAVGVRFGKCVSTALVTNGRRGTRMRTACRFAAAECRARPRSGQPARCPKALRAAGGPQSQEGSETCCYYHPIVPSCIVGHMGWGQHPQQALGVRRSAIAQKQPRRLKNSGCFEQAVLGSPLGAKLM